MDRRKLVRFVFILVLAHSKAENQVPKGHLQPLGSHQPPDEFLEIAQEVPKPEHFFNRYVLPGVPLLFKGAAKSIPAYSKWTDEYLRWVNSCCTLPAVRILKIFVSWYYSLDPASGIWHMQIYYRSIFL